MSELIDSIIKTREATAGIFAKSLIDINGLSEIGIGEKILTEVKKNNDIFPEGWYSPPPKGVAILLDHEPFERLKFQTLREASAWPNGTSTFEKESVGMIFFSPVHRKTNMIGDIGFTLYRGENKEIKRHIKKSYYAILKIAEHAKVGMSFPDLHKFATNLLKKEFEIVGWTTTNLKAKPFINFGHTIPGSFERGFVFGKTFEEIKESIRTSRFFITEVENFKITETCAFTVETRLINLEKPQLPIVYFHFIVCFDKGKKIILENFDDIFKVVGMDYIYE